MNNQWVTPGGDPIDSDWAPPSNPMPPSNDWNDASGCNASSGPAIVDGITITGVPAQIVAPYAWGITLNDGAAPPNFSIDHYDANGRSDRASDRDRWGERRRHVDARPDPGARRRD